MCVLNNSHGGDKDIAFPFVCQSYGYVRVRSRKSRDADRSDIFMGVAADRAALGWERQSRAWRRRTQVNINLKKIINISILSKITLKINYYSLCPL